MLRRNLFPSSCQLYQLGLQLWETSSIFISCPGFNSSPSFSLNSARCFNGFKFAFLNTPFIAFVVFFSLASSVPKEEQLHNHLFFSFNIYYIVRFNCIIVAGYGFPIYINFLVQFPDFFFPNLLALLGIPPFQFPFRLKVWIFQAFLTPWPGKACFPFKAFLNRLEGWLANFP